jgi:hypothetical protein
MRGEGVYFEADSNSPCPQLPEKFQICELQMFTTARIVATLRQSNEPEE